MQIIQLCNYEMHSKVQAYCNCVALIVQKKHHFELVGGKVNKNIHNTTLKHRGGGGGEDKDHTDLFLFF